jgi:hypothetical protein
MQTLPFGTRREQDELLNIVMEQSEEVGDEEVVTTGVDDLNGLFQRKRPKHDAGKDVRGFTSGESRSKKNKDDGRKRNALFKKWSKG